MKHETLDHLRDEIRAKKQMCKYPELERVYGVNRYYLWHIINDPGYQPPAKVAAQLGLQVMAPAPVCPIHHVVHVRATCPGNQPRRVRWVRGAGHAGGRWM
jgi:hypothetical protein